MSERHELFAWVAERAAEYRATVGDRPVQPVVDPDAVRKALGDLADDGVPAREVVEQLADAVTPALTGSVGPRDFGFVTGGSLDAATAADMLAVGWDQLAYSTLSSPAAAIVEEVAGAWLKEIFGLPSSAAFGFVTGAQGANTVGLAAARHRAPRALVTTWNATG